MERQTYLKRIADGLLQERLRSSGAVLVEGPKWCGKTATATRASNSQLFMQDPDKSASYLMAADTKPSLLLQGDTPRLLDEWQSAPVYGMPYVSWSTNGEESRAVYSDRIGGATG